LYVIEHNVDYVIEAFFASSEMLRVDRTACKYMKRYEVRNHVKQFIISKEIQFFFLNKKEKKSIIRIDAKGFGKNAN